MALTFEAIKNRYSTRGYTSEQLTEDELNKIILAGLHAPTATNRQEIRFSVIPGDNAILEELDTAKNGGIKTPEGRPNFYCNAPVLILLSAEDGFKWSELDAGIAVQNMALEAEELGLGSLIIGCIKDAMSGDKKDYFNKACKIPDGYSFRIAIAVGHKAAVKAPHTFSEEKQVVYL